MPTLLTRRRSLAVGAIGVTSVLLSAASAAKTDRRLSGPIPNVEIVTPLPPLRLAIPYFVATTARLEQTALDITRAIRPLLQASGPFHIVDTDEVNARRVAFDAKPLPADWQSADISFLVVGQVSEITDTRMGVAFRLWELSTQQQMTGQTYKADSGDWLRVARVIAGEIFERTNGG